VRRLCAALATLAAFAAVPAHASKTKLRLERIDTSNFDSDGIVRFYASVVDLEGTVDDSRPAPAFGLKINGKNVGPPEKAQPFQLSGEPLDLVLVVESSALYGPKNAIPTAAAPAPKPPKGAAKPAAPAAHGKRLKGKKGSAGQVHVTAPPAPKGSPNEEPLDRVKEAVLQLLESASPKWRILLIDYGGDVNAHPPFRNAGAMQTDIDDITPDDESGDLRLVQAVNAALIELNKPRKDGILPRRLIVVVSDGLNFQMDRKVFRTIGDQAAHQLVPIHSIAFSPTDDRGPLINLGEISKRSNGTFRWARTSEDLHNQIETLADEVQKQYVLTYKPDMRSLEGKTFQLISGDLVSNPLRFSAGSILMGQTASRGLGWWWLLIVAGALGLVGVVLVLMNRTETAFIAGPGMAPRAPMAPPAQAQAPQPPAGPRNALRIGDSPAPQQAAAPARATGARGVLQVISGGLSGTRVAVGQGQAPVTIGKGPSTLQITDDPSVSTRHAQVAGTPHGVVLTDLGSTNGTYVNNSRISQPVLLSDGDMIRFGQTQMKFRVE
jgi:hypothetical protein